MGNIGIRKLQRSKNFKWGKLFYIFIYQLKINMGWL